MCVLLELKFDTVKKFIFITANLLFLIGYSQEYNLIDSLLKIVREDKITNLVIDRALSVPYNKIINDLNKNLVVFETIEKNNLLLKDKIKHGDIKEKLALIYYLKGNFSKSIQYHQEAINLFNKAGDKLRVANVIARQAYESKKRNLKESIRLMRESVSLLRNLNAKQDLSSALNNYGVLFEMSHQLDSAMFYYTEALSIQKELKDSIGIPYSLNNIAGIYILKKDIKEAIKTINQSIEIRKKLKDDLGLAWDEYALGDFFKSQKNLKEAQKHFHKSHQLAVKTSYLDLQSRNLKSLADILAEKNQFDSAYYYFNSFFSIYDSLFNINTQKQLLEMETLYESERKASQIKELHYDNELKENELNSKNNIQNLLLLIIGLSLVVVVMIFRAYMQKNKANKIISKQKLETEKQKLLIDRKQKEILDSIKYAKRIQEAHLPNLNFLNKHLKNKS